MYVLIRRMLLLYLMTPSVVRGDCVQSEHCHCAKDGIYYDLYCEMAFPYLEVTGNNTVFRRLYISADTNHYRVEGRFTNVHVNHAVITGNNITDLDCDLLQGLIGVWSVDIVDTKLTRIPTCTLYQNTNITSLSIINSQINELPRRAFVVLPNLKRIVLRHNCLTNIRFDTFNGVDHLTSLDLSFNCLSGSFTSEPLSHLTKLTYLDISHNNVSSLNVKFLDYVSASERSDFPPTGSNLTQAHINFAWNRINTITKFQIQVRPSDLEHTSFKVDLSHNELETMPEISLDEPKQSHVSIDLNISNNHIGLFDRDPVICNFCRKVTLRMSIANNILKSFPPCHLHIIEKYNMQLINLSHNQIDGSVNRLCGAEDLRILDLSFNRLTAVGELGFEGKPSDIRELYISGNLISAIAKIDMVNVAETLRIVDLTNNSLSDYQQIVDSIPANLTYIDLTKNPFNCTFDPMFWENQTICRSRDVIYGARCAQPMVFRGIQVLCLPGLNCSNLQRCEQDTYMELSLNTKFKHKSLYLHWEAVGPGIKKVSEFILTIVNMDLNITHRHLFVHRLSRNYTVVPIPFNTRYRCCIKAMIFNMPTDKACYLMATGTGDVIEQTSYIVIIIGTTLGITAANVGISFLVWRVCKRRHRSRHRTTLKQIVEEEPQLGNSNLRNGKRVSANQTLPKIVRVSSGQMPGTNSGSTSEYMTTSPSPIVIKRQKSPTDQSVIYSRHQTNDQMHLPDCERKMAYLIPSHHEEVEDTSSTDSNIGCAVSLSSANPMVSSCSSTSTLLANEEREDTVLGVLNAAYSASSSPGPNDVSEDTDPVVATVSTKPVVKNLASNSMVAKVHNSFNSGDMLYDYSSNIVENEASDDTYPKVVKNANSDGSEYQSMEVVMQKYYLNVDCPSNHQMHSLPKSDICDDYESNEVNSSGSVHPIRSDEHKDTLHSEDSYSHYKELRTKNLEKSVTTDKVDCRYLSKQPGPFDWENHTTGESSNPSVSSTEYFASAVVTSWLKGSSDA